AVRGADIYTMSHAGQGWPATIAAGFSLTNALPTASPSIPAAACRAFYNIDGRESNPYALHPTCDHVSLKCSSQQALGLERLDSLM
ncbi:MAG TPA: hypothetical protein VH196_03825, partial [Terriglobales bacterium]|nr:hypothetical protein [Terriglobales bacterium]